MTSRHLPKEVGLTPDFYGAHWRGESAKIEKESIALRWINRRNELFRMFDESLPSPTTPPASYGQRPTSRAIRSEGRVHLAQSEGEATGFYRVDGNVKSVEEVIDDLIRVAIAKYDGNVAETAYRIGVGRSTLYRKLSKIGIKVEL